VIPTRPVADINDYPFDESPVGVVSAGNASSSRLGSYNFDLDEHFRPNELRDDEQHRRWARLAEKARADLRISRDVVSSCQILRDLHDIGGRSPPTESPGVPEVISHRKFGLASMASL
jgi:hypothetical protein